MSDNELLAQIARKIADLERKLRSGNAIAPSFDIHNDTRPLLITANQNDYDPGNYDVIFIQSNAAYTISGLAGGIQGRTLEIWNVGGFTLTISHNSTASLASNRIISSTAADISLSTQKGMRLTYDITAQRWRTNGN